VLCRSVVAALAFFGCVALSATPSKAPPAQQPTEVKVVSVPPAQPAEVKITSMPPAQPTQVRVLESPSDPWSEATVILTGALVLANFALCIITVWMARSQGKDARTSIEVAGKAAAAAQVSAAASSQSAQLAARNTRVAFEREVHVSAHRLAVQATLLQNMVSEVRQLYKSSFIRAGQSPAGSSRAKMYDDAQDQREKRINSVSSEANSIAGVALRDQSDDELLGYLKTLDALSAEVEALKEQVAGERDTLRGDDLMQRQRGMALMDEINKPRRP
jgi:hypothetical protein